MTDATWVYLRIMGYVGWAFACFCAVPLMQKLGYIPAVLSILFSLQAIALFLFITGHTIANDWIVQYGVTTVQWSGLFLVGVGLIQATRNFRQRRRRTDDK